jgi:transposase
MVLFPQAMRDALGEDHIVFRILEVVESLDLSSITDRMGESDPRGTRPYHPRMMLGLLMYGYCCGIYSSREIAAATYDIIPFRVLTGDQHPHFTVINEFRLRHLDAFVDLFVQVLRLCGRAGLLDLEHVSLDGSKIEANASKHKAMSYGRMEQEVARLELEIREFTAKAEAVDAEEDELYGEGKEAHEIGEELRRREERLKRIAQAKRGLEEEARRERGLRERARRLRSGAETEGDPIERKRKQRSAVNGPSCACAATSSHWSMRHPPPTCSLPKSPRTVPIAHRESHCLPRPT